MSQLESVNRELSGVHYYIYTVASRSLSLSLCCACDAYNEQVTIDELSLQVYLWTAFEIGGAL